MNELILIAEFLSKYGIIPVLVLIILQLIGFDNLRKAFGVPNPLTIKEDDLNPISFIDLLASVETQNRTLLENHFQHEIPDIIASLGRIEILLTNMNASIIRIEDRTKKNG